jgi:hypothetical protein
MRCPRISRSVNRSATSSYIIREDRMELRIAIKRPRCSQTPFLFSELSYLELQHILLGNTTDPSLSYSCNHLLISTQIINSKDRKETTKMRLSTILVSASTALLSIPSTTARITGFYAPATVVPGETLPILIRAENYIQSVQDVAVAFGITPVEDYYPGTLGTFMGETSIGPGE